MIMGDIMDDKIKVNMKEIYEEFYQKPYEQILNEDMESIEEIEYVNDVGNEIIQ